MEALSPTHFQERNLWANSSLTFTEEEDPIPSFLDNLISGLSNYIWAALGGGIMVAIGASGLGYLKCNNQTPTPPTTTTAPPTVPATNIQMNFTNKLETPTANPTTPSGLHSDPPPYTEAVQTSRWGNLRNSFYKQKKTHQTPKKPAPETIHEPIQEPEPEAEGGWTLAEMGI